MKSKSNITLYVIIGIAVVGLIVLFAIYYNPEKKFDWYTTFDHNKNQPYDFSLFKSLISESYDFQKIDDHGLTKTFSAIDNPKTTNYIFVGRYPYHSRTDAQALYDFANEGGVVFLLCDNVPDSVLRSFVVESDCRDDLIDSKRLKSVAAASIEAKFIHPTLRSKDYNFSFKKGVKDTSEYNWAYIDNHYYDEDYCYGKDAFASVGYFRSKAGLQYTNFVRAKIGSGAIYWHSNPVLFSNLYLGGGINKTGFNYIDKVLAHGNSEKVIWDFASTVSPIDNDFDMPPRSYDKPKTPLEYIFSQPALAWAWLLLIGMAVLYGLFGAKRRQRIIPIVETNNNTSLEFVKTIGRLYFQQQNHSIIFQKIMQLYLSHLRQRYSIVVREMDEATISHIVTRSDVPKLIVSDIFAKYLELNHKLTDKEVEMSPETLNNFYILVEKFYAAEESRKLASAQK